MKISTMRNNGRMLLEVLLILVIIAGILPFLQKQNMKKKTALENATIAGEILKVKSIFQSYLDETPVLFDNTNVTQTKQISFETLYDFGIPSSIKETNRFNMTYTLLGRRKVLSSGTPIIEGLILLSVGTLKPLQTRKLTIVLGPEGGYTEEGFIYSSNQSWMDTTKAWSLNLSEEHIVLKITSTQGGVGYIHKSLTGDPNNQIMKTDLKMGYNDIIDIGELHAESMEIFDTLFYENAINGETHSINSFEMLNLSSYIDLENDTCEKCPVIDSILLEDITKKANIIGSARILGNLNIENEITISNNLFLSGTLNANNASTYMADISELNVESFGDEDVGYTVKTKDLNISQFTISDLTAPIGMFNSIALSSSSSIIDGDTYFNSNDLVLKDIIIKSINKWIWNEKDNCNIYNDPSRCLTTTTKPLYDCLTRGYNTFSRLEEGQISFSGKGYPIIKNKTGEGENFEPGFVDSVLFSDVVDCLKTLTDITCSEGFCN